MRNRGRVQRTSDAASDSLDITDRSVFQDLRQQRTCTWQVTLPIPTERMACLAPTAPASRALWPRCRSPMAATSGSAMPPKLCVLDAATPAKRHRAQQFTGGKKSAYRRLFANSVLGSYDPVNLNGKRAPLVRAPNRLSLGGIATSWPCGPLSVCDATANCRAARGSLDPQDSLSVPPNARWSRTDGFRAGPPTRWKRRCSDWLQAVRRQ